MCIRDSTKDAKTICTAVFVPTRTPVSVALFIVVHCSVTVRTVGGKLGKGGVKHRVIVVQEEVVNLCRQTLPCHVRSQSHSRPALHLCPFLIA